ncbi:MAG: sugar phosphate isomerase/epimerase family protein [Tepidisphaeraceae bacterium]
MADLFLSCADFTFPLLPHAQALRLIGMMGFVGVDVGVFAGRSHLRPEHVAANPSTEGASIRRLANECGLAIADVFVQLGEDPARHAVSETDAAVRSADRDAFLRCVAFAHAAGATHMTGLPGVDTGDGIGRAAEQTAWRLAACAEAGLRYAVEAHVGSNCPTIAATLTFLEKVPGLTLTLDYGHFVYQGHPAEAADALMPHASHFHARAAAPGRLQAGMKANVIDFTPMARRAATERQKVCVEYVWVDWEHCNEVDNVSETLLMRDHLSELAKERK